MGERFSPFFVLLLLFFSCKSIVCIDCLCFLLVISFHSFYVWLEVLLLIFVRKKFSKKCRNRVYVRFLFAIYLCFISIIHENIVFFASKNGVDQFFRCKSLYKKMLCLCIKINGLYGFWGSEICVNECWFICRVVRFRKREFLQFFILLNCTDKYL